jgi:hypothetical protein
VSIPNLIPAIELAFGLRVSSAVPFARRPDDPVVNLILETVSGEKFFLKEIQRHSLRPELEGIYLGLSALNLEGYRLVLPLRDLGGKFGVEVEGRRFHLLRYENIMPFCAEQVPVGRMISVLSDFHAKVRGLSVQEQGYRSFGNWLQRGPDQMKQKFGKGLPFLDLLEEHLNSRFPSFRFEEGVIHWDIHRENLGMGPKGELLILDFDLLQPGAYAMDWMRLLPLYRVQREDRTEIPDEVFEAVYAEVALRVKVDPSAQAPGFERRDLRLWAGRAMMMEAWNHPDPRGFMRAIEAWVEGGTPHRVLLSR